MDLRQTYLVLKLKFVKGRCYETYNTIEKKKEHKEEAKAEEETAVAEEEPETPILLISHVKKRFFTHIFPMLNCTSLISKITNLMDCVRANLTFPTTSKGQY